MNDTASRIKSIIAEKLGVDETTITHDTKFLEDLGADSLDTVEIIMEIENAFGFTIPDEYALEMKTVGEAIDYVEQNAIQ